MSHIRHNPAMGPLTSLEVSLKHQTGKLLKQANRLSSEFLLWVQARLAQKQLKQLHSEKQHKSLGIALTAYRYPQTTLQWFSSIPILILSAIFMPLCIIHSIYAPARSSTEHVFRYSLPWKMKMATAKVRCKGVGKEEGGRGEGGAETPDFKFMLLWYKQLPQKDIHS